MSKDLAVFTEESYRPYGEAWRWRMGGYAVLLAVGSTTAWSIFQGVRYAVGLIWAS